MAKKTIYIPFYEDGAYHWLAVTGEHTGDPVPEGKICISSAAIGTTPPRRLQPTSHKRGRE